MQRREVIRLLLGTAALPLLPREVFAILRQVRNELPNSSAQTLNLTGTRPSQPSEGSSRRRKRRARGVRVNEFMT